jgi:DnaJ-class molecular chaperone
MTDPWHRPELSDPCDAWPRMVDCPDCDGRGGCWDFWGEEWDECHDCLGIGVVTEADAWWHQQEAQMIDDWCHREMRAELTAPQS